MRLQIILISVFSVLITANDRLNLGGTLSPGQSLESPNGCFKLTLQSDGNLVIYRKSDNSAIWSTGVKEGVDKALLRRTGNFVLLDGTKEKWSTNTNNANVHLVMQDDGNLVLVNKKNNNPIWNSKSASSCTSTASVPSTDRLLSGATLKPGESITSARKSFLLILQGDGSLVIYKTHDMTPVWYTGASPGVDRAIMQTDGNFVLYAGYEHKWNSGTVSNPNAYLVLQDDGNLVIYNSNNYSVWSSNSAPPGYQPFVPLPDTSTSSGLVFV